MISRWFEAVSETDKELAEALLPFKATAPSPPPVQAEEAEKLALGWLADQFPIPNVLILPGVSQVDLIEPILKRKDNLCLLLVERQLDRLAAALNGVDSPLLADAIRNGRLLLDIGESEDRAIERFLTVADFSRVPRIRLMEARKLSDDECALAVEMTKAAREFVRLQTCDMSTRDRFGAEWQTNTLRNLPRIMKEARIGSLFGQFAGMPALVVAAGPSLDDALPYIVEHRKRFLVIAVGRSLNRLLQGKVRPDLLVTGDGQDMVRNQFKFKPPKLPVAASTFTNPDLIGELDRIFFMEMTAVGLLEWVQGKIGEMGEIHPGGNVASAAMSVAVELGCNPVLTVGFDLSYTDDGKTHASGKAGRGLTPDRTYYDVPGNYQPIVKTNRQMWHYINFAQEYIAEHPETTFINVNTGGARIEGMQLAKPEELAQYAGEPANAASAVAKIYRESSSRETDGTELCEALQEDVERLRTLQRECTNAAMISNRLLMLMRCPHLTPNAEEVVRACLAELDPVDTRLKTDPVMHLIESRLEQVARMLSERMMSPEERAQPPAIRSHRRWREFYKGVAEACQCTEKLLVEAIKKIEGDGSVSAQPTLCNTKPEPVEVSG